MVVVTMEPELPLICVRVACEVMLRDDERQQSIADVLQALITESGRRLMLATAMHHKSHVTRHTSRVTRHASHVTRHLQQRIGPISDTKPKALLCMSACKNVARDQTTNTENKGLAEVRSADDSS